MYRDEDLFCTPKSLYRSVVFHPTEDLVLPGILSHAYTFDGDLKPLFLSSKCCFCICSISADETKMLTDCPDDGKSIIMWSLTDGSEINRFAWSHDFVSFAWSPDGRLLAISDLSGSVGLLDLVDGYRTQETMSDVYGMIKFSPDCRCFYSLDFNSARCDLLRLNVNRENDGNFSLDVLTDEVSYQPWEFESWEFESCTGFLLGDPFCFPSERDTHDSQRPSLAFVLNNQSVLTVAYSSTIIEMLQLDKLTKDSAEVLKTTVTKVVLSLNGDTLFVLTTPKGSPSTLMGWDISSGMFKPGKLRVCRCTGWFGGYTLVALSEGVLCQTSPYGLQLWNFELSRCIRSWPTDLKHSFKVIPISEERVVCYVLLGVKSKFIIVDTTRESTVSTITIDGTFVACNSKCHVITADGEELQMQCGQKVLWRISLPYKLVTSPCVTFSPTEQYCVLQTLELYVLDVESGKILHKCYRSKYDYLFLCDYDCKFISDEECVVYFGTELGYFLRLFNVKSGDLLSEIALECRVCSLAACPRESLVAIGFRDSKMKFKVLRVKLPGDKHSRKSKGRVLLISNKVTIR